MLAFGTGAFQVAVPHLSAVELCVFSIELQQLIVRAAFDDSAILQHDDPVGFA